MDERSRRDARASGPAPLLFAQATARGGSASTFPIRPKQQSRLAAGLSGAFTRERHSRDQPEGLSPAGEFRNVEESNSVGAPEGTGSGAVEGSELNMTDDEEQIRRLIERGAEAVQVAT